MSFDTSRLYSTLLTSRLQQDNPALYQVVYQLIGALSSAQQDLLTLNKTINNDVIVEPTTNIFQIVQGSRESSGGSGRPIPGPQGIQGVAGANGASLPGPLGIIKHYVEQYPRYVPFPGPVGSTGTTGAQGPIGAVIPSKYIEIVRRPIQIFQGSSSSGSGKLVQVVNTQTGTVATGTTKIPMDNTIPQKTEGDEYMSLSITPTSAANKLKIDIVGEWSPDAANWVTVALFQDTTTDALASLISYMGVGTGGLNFKFTHYMTAGTTSSTTFKVRAGQHTASGTTLTFNGESGNQRMGGTMASSITISEIVP